jgi:hypothetical protein
MVQYLDFDTFENDILFLKNLKEDFEIVTTSNTKYYSYKKMKYFFDPDGSKQAEALTKSELLNLHWFKKTVDKEQKENPIKGKVYPHHINYILVNFDKTQNTDIETEDIFEIDVSSAYLNLAYQHGFINKKYYDLFYDARKPFRLLALGSLATKRTTQHYKKGKLVKSETVQNEETAQVFYQTAFLLSQIMTEILKEVKGIYFYWVDAFFCTKDALKEIQERLEQKGLGYKIDKHKRIKKQGNRIEVKYTKEMQKKKKKKFKYYHFSAKNTLHTGARIARELIELDKVTRQHLKARSKLVDDTENVFWDVERDILISNIAQVFGSAEITKYTRESILDTFNKYGLDYTDYLRTEERYKETHKELTKCKLQSELKSDEERIIFYSYVSNTIKAFSPDDETRTEKQVLENYGEIDTQTTCFFYNECEIKAA